jgi:uncharacterized membrane protein
MYLQLLYSLALLVSHQPTPSGADDVSCNRYLTHLIYLLGLAESHTIVTEAWWSSVNVICNCSDTAFFIHTGLASKLCPEVFWFVTEF